MDQVAHDGLQSEFNTSEKLDVAPRPILRLGEDVVNRIAAGEIIHRPSNALKELLENSLDAGATQIHISLQEGGLKMLRIQDNGKGIPVSDLPLLCERFATSKLRQFSDLDCMQTFGFRGEALASISYVSSLITVVSKTRDEDMAYRATYFAGKLHSSDPNQAAQPKPCAGTDGTTIGVQDLFFNAPQRRNVFKSGSEEYHRSLDVVTRYAIHYGSQGIGFSMKKIGASSFDLNTPSDGKQTTADIIRFVHGATLARDLLYLAPTELSTLGCSVQGWVSNADWVSKKTSFLCFINNRLVDCGVLRRSLELMYSSVLPKGRNPWIYISLTIEPNRIDVNVHPTKQEVHFLDQDEIVEQITAAVHELVTKHSSCRVLSTGSSLGIVTSERNVQVLGPRSKSSDPRHLVRVDPQSQSLDAVMAQNSSSSQKWQENLDLTEPVCDLTSIQELREAVHLERHVVFTEVIQNHTFVGVIDFKLGTSLIQHGTQLYMVDHSALIACFAYQLALRHFSAFQSIAFDPPLPLRQMLAIGFQTECIASDTPVSSIAPSQREAILSDAYDTLVGHAEMLEEYFSLTMDSRNETLNTFPALFPQHLSNVVIQERVPSFLFRLATQVDWTDEKECLERICHEIAFAHIPWALGTEPNDNARIAWNVQHIWFAGMLSSRSYFSVGKRDAAEIFTQVASLPDLYRVFERC
ncbi:DNA mismatch repair protein Mlh1 [Malassezia yamatoensis]|uniref:DNA mismatch repair protein Mlh1 n=1 Tax=Malassezia yamatoensis TaxID=253288 RepID=A0AAJ5YW14_9BASI|nr:DNA mismatch repair protein Mlh1 [Malassezia yamatoensis]